MEDEKYVKLKSWGRVTLMVFLFGGLQGFLLGCLLTNVFDFLKVL